MSQGALSAELEHALVGPAATLRDVLVSLDRTGYNIVLAQDGEGRLLGTVTDGDVRRALLDGADLGAAAAPFVQRHFTAVSPDAPRAEVLDLMRARSLLGIPIVDGAGRLRGLHLLREIVGAPARPNWAVVMAGGQGTRLRPLTQTRPKPMVTVAGRPILERLVLHLVGAGVHRIFVAVHYLADVIEQHFGDGARFGARIEYLREPEPWGSGGALSLLPSAPSEPLLVVNGDLVTQVDLGAMFDFHARERCRATVGVRPYQHEVPFGCVELDGTGVVSIEEKPILTRVINAGLYVLDPDLPSRVPAAPFAMPALLEDCLVRQERVGAFMVEDEWIDVGQAEQLRLARQGAS